MPIYGVDYSRTHFYKIVCRDLNIKDCYVGHTTDFNTRKHQHKRTCYDEKDPIHYNFYVYQFIREHGGWENWDMILIDTLECENNLKARAKEREFIEEIKPTLNQIKKPYRTEEEATTYRREHYAQNSEEIKQKNRQYRIDNPEKTKATAKKYRDNHKEEASIRNRKWREKNHERIQEERKVKHSCECGATYTKGHKTRHEKSNKHKEYLQALNEI